MGTALPIAPFIYLLLPKLGNKSYSQPPVSTQDLALQPVSDKFVSKLKPVNKRCITRLISGHFQPGLEVVLASSPELKVPLIPRPRTTGDISTVSVCSDIVGQDLNFPTNAQMQSQCQESPPSPQPSQGLEGNIYSLFPIAREGGPLPAAWRVREKRKAYEIFKNLFLRFLQ